MENTVFGVDEDNNLYLCKKIRSSMYNCEYTTSYPNTNSQNYFNLLFLFVLLYMLISKVQNTMVSSTSPMMDSNDTNKSSDCEEDSTDDSTEDSTEDDSSEGSIEEDHTEEELTKSTLQFPKTQTFNTNYTQEDFTVQRLDEEVKQATTFENNMSSEFFKSISEVLSDQNIKSVKAMYAKSPKDCIKVNTLKLRNALLDLKKKIKETP
jgi:hypothetical protein